MKATIVSLVFLLGLVSSCSTITKALPPEFCALNVPLHSDQGQLALASLIQWSGPKKIDHAQFIPLSTGELKEMRGMFVNDVVPGEQAGFGHDNRILDRNSKKEGMAVAILATAITTNGEGFVILKTLQRGGTSEYKLHLRRTNESWLIQDRVVLVVGDYFFRKPENLPPKLRISGTE